MKSKKEAFLLERRIINGDIFDSRSDKCGQVEYES